MTKQELRNEIDKLHGELVKTKSELNTYKEKEEKVKANALFKELEKLGYNITREDLSGFGRYVKSEITLVKNFNT